MSNGLARPHRGYTHTHSFTEIYKKLAVWRVGAPVPRLLARGPLGPLTASIAPQAVLPTDPTRTHIQ